MSDTVSNELLPCPFCGQAAYVSWPDSARHMVEIGCPDNWHPKVAICPVGPAVADMDYHKAVADWNRRAPSSELLELREAVKPFAALGQYMIDEGFTTKPDDATMWGFDRHDLTYGDFRRLAALSEQAK